MTVFEQTKQFEMMLQTTSEQFNDAEKPDSDTILLYLNIAQLRYLKEKYLSTQTFETNMQSVNMRTEEFRSLIVTLNKNSGLTSYYANYGKVLNLPSDYLFYLKSDSKVTRITVYPCVNQYVPNEEVNFKDVDKLLTTPFNQPVIQKPAVIFKDNENDPDHPAMVIIHDKYTTISEVAITYVRKPKRLALVVNNASAETSTCELAAYTHDEITALAVQLYEQYKYRLAGVSAKQPKQEGGNE